MIHLEKITYKNYDAIIDLTVNKKQKNYVARNIYSLAEAYAFQADGGKVFPLAIYNGKRPVGFAMVGYDFPYADDDDKEKYWFFANNYIIWRFMIDKRYQNRGFGKEAFKQVLDFVRSKPCGDAEYVWLSYEPENEVAKKLYASFGFVEEPKGFDPTVEGDEMPAILKL